MRRGHFERSSGGTVFLDEISEMPIELQVKLLRVLESGELTRVGGEQPIAINLRLIAATNRVPKQAVINGTLREDLYYRLNVFPLALPPLRERDGDALLLADKFLEGLNATADTKKRLSAGARAHIQGYSFPGNVRELQNEIQRSFIMAEEVLEMDDLGTHVMAAGPGAATVTPTIGTSLEASERHLILATLEHCAGDKKKAAEVLGISLKTLYNRLNSYAGR